MRQQLQKSEETIFKKLFFAIDLLIVTMVLLLMPKFTYVTLFLSLLLFCFRANLSLMMFYGERKVVVGSLIMLLVGAYFVISKFYIDIVINLLSRYIENHEVAEFVWIGLIGWFCYMPFLSGIIQIFYAKRPNRAKISDMFMFTYCKRTPIKREFTASLLLLVLVIVAQFFGLKGRVILDSVWYAPFALLVGWLITIGMSVDWLQVKRKFWLFAGVFSLLTAVWISQYMYSGRLIVLILSYVFGIGLSGYVIFKGTQNSTLIKVIKSVTMAATIFFILPFLAFGYNLLTCTEYVRIGTFQDQYFQKELSEFVGTKWQKRVKENDRPFYLDRGVYYIKDSDGNIGLRDRRGAIIPVKYEAIEACGLPYYKIKSGGLWGVYDDSGAYMYRNYYFVNENSKSGVVVDCQFSSITPAFQEGMFIVTNSEGKQGLINLRIKKYDISKTGNEFVVVPLEFDSIQHIEFSHDDRYFLVSKKSENQELLGLYTKYGEKLAENCVSIIPIQNNQFEITDVLGCKNFTQ